METCFLPTPLITRTFLDLTFALPVIELIQVFVLDHEGQVVRAQGLFLEEVGQTIVLGGQTRSEVEIPFRLENLFAQGGDVIGGKVQAVESVQEVDEGLESLGLIHDREGDE